MARGTGHWARYLVASPPSTQGYRYVSSQQETWECLAPFYDRINTLIDTFANTMQHGSAKRETIEFSAAAADRYLDLARQTEWMVRPGDCLHDIHDFAAKAMEIMSRLAAVLHKFSGENGPISLATFEAAYEITNWHIGEYRRHFSKEVEVQQVQANAYILYCFLRERVWRGPGNASYIPKNQLLQYGPLREKSQLDPALVALQNAQAIWIGAAPKGNKKFVNLVDAFFQTVI